MHHPTDRTAHTTAFFTPVVEHWPEREIAQWVHPTKDRSERPIAPRANALTRRSYISLIGTRKSSMGPPHEGLIRTTHRTMSERSYQTELHLAHWNEKKLNGSTPRRIDPNDPSHHERTLLPDGAIHLTAEESWGREKSDNKNSPCFCYTTRVNWFTVLFEEQCTKNWFDPFVTRSHSIPPLMRACLGRGVGGGGGGGREGGGF